MEKLKDYLDRNYKIFVITFRREAWKQKSLEWFRPHLSDMDMKRIQFYFCPTEYQTDDYLTYKKNVVEFKSKIINDNKLTIYYDTDFLVEALVEKCPETLIRKV